jgi:glutamyl-tRNA synthetase
LFNWLFARRHGGQYLLRIEDTDLARSTPEAVQAIFAGLDWLGVESDGQATFQAARASRHRELAELMLEKGTAFRCYVTPGELEERRAQGTAAREALSALKKDANATEAERAQAQGRVDELTRAFRSPYRDGKASPAAHAPYVVRLRAPDDGEIVNDDLVQGRVAVRAGDIDDLILLRSDGTPTYMLSVVCDDIDMGITHVIRGDDHLTNAARQIPIYRALNAAVPAFAHIPLIHGPDGAKLSKRHGAQAVHEYRDLGYLPEGLNSYLLRLGWSPGHDDILTKEEAALVFDLSQVGKAPARLDFDKLASVNAHFIKLAGEDRLLQILIEFINTQRPDWAIDEEKRAKLALALPILKQRAKTIAELADQSFFLLRTRPYTLDGPAQKAMKDEAKALLHRLARKLETASSWDHEGLGALIKGFAQDEGVGLGQFGPALRAALTGGAASPELGQLLFLLGRAESLARLKDHL